MFFGPLGSVPGSVSHKYGPGCGLDIKKYENRCFCVLKVDEDFGTDPDPVPDPDSLVRGTVPRIRISIRICTTILSIWTHWFRQAVEKQG
jgi:hypothetical protein